MTDNKAFVWMSGMVLFTVVVVFAIGSCTPNRNIDPIQKATVDQTHNVAFNELYKTCIDSAPKQTSGYDYQKLVEACERVAQTNTR